MSQDRRNFLKNVGTGAAAAAAVAKLSETTVPAASNTVAILSPVEGNNNQIKLALELDGEFAGWLSSVEGGNAIGEIFEHKNENGFIKKEIANVKYQDISVSCGFAMSKAFYDWIGNSFKQNYIRKSGSIIAADYDYNTTSTLAFFNALVSEVGFPSVDADSKDSSKLTLKFAPEFTEYKYSSGRLILDETQSKQEFAIASDFKFEIEGVKGSSRVNKIEGFTIKQSFNETAKVEERGYLKEPAKLEFPNLKITLPEIAAEEFAAWHNKTVVDGESKSTDHKTASLVYLNRSRQKELLTLTFTGLDIYNYSPEARSDQHKNTIPQVKAEVFCEEISFKFGPVLE
jgi:hypothetical protein